MKLDAMKLGCAAAATFAVLWILCSTMVMFMPGAMMTMSGHMVHADLSSMEWHLDAAGFAIGLCAWTIVAGVTGWLLAVIYNRMLSATT